MKTADSNSKMDVAAEIFRIKLSLERIISPITKKHGLTPAAAIFLHLVEKCDEPTVKDVIKEAELNQGNASTMCKRLEAEGYIIRKRSTSDERSVTLRLTEKGTSALRSTEAELRSVISSVRGLSERDILCAREGIKAIASLTDALGSNILIGEKNA